MSQNCTPPSRPWVCLFSPVMMNGCTVNEVLFLECLLGLFTPDFKWNFCIRSIAKEVSPESTWIHLSRPIFTRVRSDKKWSTAAMDGTVQTSLFNLDRVQGLGWCQFFTVQKWSSRTRQRHNNRVVNIVTFVGWWIRNSMECALRYKTRWMIAWVAAVIRFDSNPLRFFFGGGDLSVGYHPCQISVLPFLLYLWLSVNLTYR